jgi:hypothetical protein
MVMTTQKMDAPSRTSNHVQHTALNRVPEVAALPKVHEASPTSVPVTQAAFGHDFSRVPLRTEAPAQRSSSCPLSPTRCPFGGACHTCSVPVQTKLKIGQPNDKYEREADRVADMVMSMPDPGVQRQVGPEELEEEEETIQPKPIAGQITPLVQRQVGPEEEEEEEPIQPKLAGDVQLQRQAEEPEEEEEESLQAKWVGGRMPWAGSDLGTQIRSLRGGGQPLPESTRAFFEPRFGYDFSQVRVHTNQRADQAARAISASSFTSGRDIGFARGKYAPGTNSGRRLLAHELAHTIQQGHSTHQAKRALVQRSFCPSHCTGRSLCRSPRRMQEGCAERGPANEDNWISHIRVLLDTRRVHLFYNGRPRTARGTKVEGTCNPNSSTTPRGWDTIGLKCPENYTNQNRYNMAWFTAFRSSHREYGFHNSQPLSGRPSHGCVRVSCELARRINRDSASEGTINVDGQREGTSIMVRNSAPGD